MKFLITGIAGFAGCYLAKTLIDEGHIVYGIVRSGKNTNESFSYVLDEKEIIKIKLFHGDIFDSKFVEKIFTDNKFDGVFHLASMTNIPISFIDPISTFNDNLLGTINVCEEIIKHNQNCILMFCSSVSVYGNYEKEMFENTPTNPIDPYSVSKLSAEIYIKSKTFNNQLKSFIVRPSSHTGPKRHYNFSISSDAYQIAKILKKQQEPIIKVGNLSCQRAIMDVRDVCSVYYKLMMKYIEGCISNGDIFNVAGENVHEIKHYIDIMLNLFDVKAELVANDNLSRKVDISIQRVNINKMKSLINWKSKYNIEITLKDLVEYWLKRS